MSQLTETLANSGGTPPKMHFLGLASSLVYTSQEKNREFESTNINAMGQHCIAVEK